jgi:hypothetical protein
MAILKGRVDGLEYKVEELSAGQFSSSTKMSGGAVFTTGFVDTNDTTAEKNAGTADNKLASQYNFTIDLNTSFTGNDGLYAQLVQGNQTGDLALQSAENTTSNSLEVGSLFYTFPVSDFQVSAGPLLDADDVISATTSAYSEGFRLAPMPYGVDGDVTGAGVAASWANDSGLNASFATVSVTGNAADTGIFTTESADHYVASLGYDSDNWGLGLIFTDDDNTTADNDTSFGAGVYFRPDGFPTISVAYDSLSDASTTDSSDFFVGLEHEVGPGTASAAYQSRDTAGTTTSNYEVFYTYPVNDGVSVSGGFFTEEQSGSTADTTGYVVETTFSF